METRPLPVALHEGRDNDGAKQGLHKSTPADLFFFNCSKQRPLLLAQVDGGGVDKLSWSLFGGVGLGNRKLELLSAGLSRLPGLLPPLCPQQGSPPWHMV